MKWDIDTPVAGGTVRSAKTRADDYSDVATGLDAIFSGANSTLQYSPPVASALGEYLWTTLQPDFDTVKGSTDLAIEKTTEALQHYQNGDFNLAANAQDGIHYFGLCVAPPNGG